MRRIPLRQIWRNLPILLALYGSIAHASEVAVADDRVQVSCPAWPHERAAEVEARARAELLVAGREGTVRLDCAEQVSVAWRTGKGTDAILLPLEVSNDAIHEALLELLSRSPTSDQPAAVDPGLPPTAPADAPTAAFPATPTPGSPASTPDPEPAAQIPLKPVARAKSEAKASPQKKRTRDAQTQGAARKAPRNGLGLEAGGVSPSLEAGVVPQLGVSFLLPVPEVSGLLADARLRFSSRAALSRVTVQDFRIWAAHSAVEWQQPLFRPFFASLGLSIDHLFIRPPEGANRETKRSFYPGLVIRGGYLSNGSPRLLFALELAALPQVVKITLDGETVARLSPIAPGATLGLEWDAFGADR